MEDYVRDIITELCKVPAVRDEFHWGDGVRAVPAQTQSSSQRFRPGQFYIHYVKRRRKDSTDKGFRRGNAESCMVLYYEYV